METVNTKQTDKNALKAEGDSVQTVVMRYGYLPAFDGEAILASCDHCSFCSDASDGLEYGRVYAPNQNYVIEAAITNAAAAGEEVYVEIVDDCSSNGWAWISVDNIATGIIPEPATLGLLAILGLAFLRRK